MSFAAPRAKIAIGGALSAVRKRHGFSCHPTRSRPQIRRRKRPGLSPCVHSSLLVLLYPNLSRFIKARNGRSPNNWSFPKVEMLCGRRYSIRLAVASGICGMVRPSAFAVLRLINSSKPVGACTGSLPGFAPLRMWSMYPVAGNLRSN